MIGTSLGAITAFFSSEFSGNVLAGVVSGLLVAVVAPLGWYLYQEYRQRDLRRRFFDIVDGPAPDLSFLHPGEYTVRIGLRPRDRAEIHKIGARFTQTTRQGASPQEGFSRVEVSSVSIERGNERIAEGFGADDGEGGYHVQYDPPGVIFARNETFHIEVAVKINTKWWPGGFLGIMCSTQHSDRSWTHIPARIDPQLRLSGGSNAE